MVSIIADYSIEGFTNRSAVLIIAAALLLAGAWVHYLNYRPKRLKFPVMDIKGDSDFKSILEEGVTKYPDIPFTVPINPPIVILPKSALSDLKFLPNEKASFWDEVKEQFHYQATGFAHDEKMLTAVVKTDLTRHIAASLDLIQDETPYSFHRAFGPCEEWTPHKIFPAVSKIIALVSNRVFVGLPLSRDNEWLEGNLNYTLFLNDCKFAVLGWPKWIVNIIAPQMKEFKKIENFRNRAVELVNPLYRAYMASKDNEVLSKYDSLEDKNGIAWFLDRMNPKERRDPRMLVTRLLDLSFVSILTTSTTVFQAILDLATYREYIPLLIEEINTVISEDGYDMTFDGNLKLRKPSMPKLVKLDSFLKESIRLNPIFIASHIRRINSDVMLSCGYTLPKGSHSAIPSWAIHNQSSALHLPGITKSLSEFDGLRFHKLRQLPGNENRHLLVSTSPESLIFGYGNHACPGRFFANNEIKVIMIELLRNWEFRFPGDVNFEGGISRRPKSNFVNFDCIPDSDAKLELRRKNV